MPEIIDDTKDIIIGPEDEPEEKSRWWLWIVLAIIIWYLLKNA